MKFHYIAKFKRISTKLMTEVENSQPKGHCNTFYLKKSNYPKKN